MQLFPHILYYRKQLLDAEEQSEFISDLVCQTVEVALTIIQHKHAEEESYQFTVQWAKQQILQTVKVRGPKCECSSLR